MTSPTDEPGFFLRMIFEKLDTIDKKVDGQGEKLATHELRITTLEEGKKNTRALWVAIGMVFLTNVIDWVKPLFIH